MVITGLTRNQVVLTGSWVRIPPAPPSKNPVTMRVCWIFLFSWSIQKSPDFGLFFPTFWKEQLFALCPAFFCVLLPSAAEIARFGKGHTAHHRLRRGEFRTVIQMGIDIRRGGKIRMPQPVLNLLERHTVGKQQ